MPAGVSVHRRLGGHPPVGYNTTQARAGAGRRRRRVLSPPGRRKADRLRIFPVVAPSPGDARERRLFALLADLLDCADSGQTPDPADLASRHPDLATELAAFFAAETWLRRLTAPVRRVVRTYRRAARDLPGG